MAFEIGITLSKPIEEQLIATLRETLPALKEFSNEEIVRRVEPADVLGAQILSELDKAFPPPKGKQSLQML